VQIDCASLLIEEITNFVKRIRGEMPEPTDYGSTKVKRLDKY